MAKTVGFIGSGNMGRAIMGGMIAAGLYAPSQILASAKTKETIEKIEKELGIVATTDNTEVARKADILFLAVKPGVFATVIPQIRDVCKEGQVVVSIAAGQTLASITDLFGRQIKLVRSMPNTPALVGEAMSAVTPYEKISPEELQEVMAIFESFGKAEIVPETMMDAVVGVSGSSPAYVYMFIEAMADAAVADGMPRKQAYKFAWRMLQLPTACQESRLINLQPSLSLGQPRWYWRQESIRGSLRMLSAPRAARPLQP